LPLTADGKLPVPAPSPPPMEMVARVVGSVFVLHGPLCPEQLVPRSSSCLSAMGRLPVLITSLGCRAWSALNLFPALLRFQRKNGLQAHSTEVICLGNISGPGGYPRHISSLLEHTSPTTDWHSLGPHLSGKHQVEKICLYGY